VILSNHDVILSIAHLDKSFENFYRNADFDELYFIHDGSGKLKPFMGHLIM